MRRSKFAVMRRRRRRTQGGSITNATQGSVTFPIVGSYTTGNYIDGPAYVVVPTGSPRSKPMAFRAS